MAEKPNDEKPNGEKPNKEKPSDGKRLDSARIHPLVFFILGITFCVLFHFYFFLGTITTYQTQGTGMILANIVSSYL